MSDDKISLNHPVECACPYCEEIRSVHVKLTAAESRVRELAAVVAMANSLASTDRQEINDVHARNKELEGKWRDAEQRANDWETTCLSGTKLTSLRSAVQGVMPILEVYQDWCNRNGHAAMYENVKANTERLRGEVGGD